MLAVPLLSRGLASSISLDSRAGCKRSPRRRSWNSHSFIRQWLAGLRKRRFFPSGNLFSEALSPGEKARFQDLFPRRWTTMRRTNRIQIQSVRAISAPILRAAMVVRFPMQVEKTPPTCVGRRCLNLASRFSCELARRKLLRRNVEHDLQFRPARSEAVHNLFSDRGARRVTTIPRRCKHRTATVGSNRVLPKQA